jgi:stage II sporulation protein D
MRRVLAVAAGLTALLAAPAYAADSDVVLAGHGWGHGVGLSQYGAYGYAKLEGRDHAWILQHYYPGTDLARQGKGSMRVLLRRTRPPKLCGVTRLRDAGGRRIRLSDRRIYKVSRLSASRLRLVDTRSRRARRVTAPATLSGGASWCLRGAADNGVSSGTYRGRAVLIPEGRAILVVNSVGIESYLRGVVPSEMPSSWAPEALQAQAVIARSYALRSRRPAAAYDVYSDTRSQVYGGIAREAATTTAAVNATRAQVVTYGGAIAETLFFSTSGGRTAGNDEIFGGSPIAYLRSVDDPHDDLSPYHSWTATFTLKALRRKLEDVGVSGVKSLKVIARTASGRAATVEVTGKSAVIDVPSARIAAMLGLRSTWFSVAKPKP